MEWIPVLVVLVTAVLGPILLEAYRRNQEKKKDTTDIASSVQDIYQSLLEDLKKELKEMKEENSKLKEEVRALRVLVEKYYSKLMEEGLIDGTDISDTGNSTK